MVSSSWRAKSLKAHICWYCGTKVVLFGTGIEMGWSLFSTAAYFGRIGTLGGRCVGFFRVHQTKALNLLVKAESRRPSWNLTRKLVCRRYVGTRFLTVIRKNPSTT